MPFVHYHVGNNGNVNACCIAPITYGNVNSQSFDEIWNGESINKLRNDFTAGIAHPKCQKCVNLEAAGHRSIRLETFDKFKEVEVNLITPTPKYFDIRFSNVCNFRCRTCWHGASSKWYKEAKKLGRQASQSAIINNINDFDAFINEMTPHLLNAKEFYFAGGEPLVTEEHYLLLNWLINNKTTNCTLRYNTNFSNLSFKEYDVLNLWSNFNKIEVQASIDATGTLGEYIRKDMDWALTMANREKARSYPNISFKIAPTISILNVQHLPELYQKCLDIEFITEGEIYFNILQYPSYYSIQALPREKKEETACILLKVINESLPINVRKGYQEIIDFMYAEDKSHLWPKFVQESTLLDKMRGEKCLIDL